MSSQERPLSFGIVGLGRIGGGLALQALRKGHRVVGHKRTAPGEALLQAGLEFIPTPSAFRERLRPPRVVFLYVPAGAAVDQVLEGLASSLEPGDVVVDGGNSYWGDSIRRQRRLLAGHRLHFVDCGTSGGARGAEHGACFMAGGTAEGYAHVAPILAALSVEGGYLHCGPPGSGHFVKLVHNGIEFGMLQAIGEGMELLARFRDPLPVADVLRTWSRGSVIRSWLIELMEETYRACGGFEQVPAHVEDTGEVNWLVEDALHLEVPIPVIAAAVLQLFQSRDPQPIWARAVAMMRHGFGAHPFGPDAGIARHRRTSRLGGWAEED